MKTENEEMKVAFLERIDHQYGHVDTVDGFWVRKNRGRLEVRDSATGPIEGDMRKTYQPVAHWKPVSADTKNAVFPRDELFGDDQHLQAIVDAESSKPPAKVVYHVMRPEFRHTSAGFSSNQKAAASLCWHRGAYKEVARFDTSVDDEDIFKLTNSIHAPWFENEKLPLAAGHPPITPNRSTSVGDLIVDEATGTASVVASFGFEQVDLDSIYESRSPLFLSTPPDLPWFLCKERLEVLRKVGDPFNTDLESLMELEELLHCYEYEKPATERVFAGSSGLLEQLDAMAPEDIDQKIGGQELSRPLPPEVTKVLQGYFEREREYCHAEHPFNGLQVSSGPSM